MKIKDLKIILEDFNDEDEIGIVDLDAIEETKQEEFIFSMNTIAIPKAETEEDDTPLSRYAYVVNKKHLIMDTGDSEVYYEEKEID